MPIDSKRTREEISGPELDGIFTYRDSKYIEYDNNCSLPDSIKLTHQEYSILLLSSYGYTAEECGLALWLSADTVKSYRKRIILKMGVRNMMHAVGQATRQGIV